MRPTATQFRAYAKTKIEEEGLWAFFDAAYDWKIEGAKVVPRARPHQGKGAWVTLQVWVSDAPVEAELEKEALWEEYEHLSNPRNRALRPVWWPRTMRMSFDKYVERRRRFKAAGEVRSETGLLLSPRPSRGREKPQRRRRKRK